jgi:hypothetical protein
MFNWRVLAGHNPILLDLCGEVDGDHLRRLVQAILRDGVRRVLRTDLCIRYLAPGAGEEVGRAA